MADIFYEAPMGAKRRFQDMGDGSWAEVVSVPGISTPSGTPREARLFRKSDASEILGGTRSVSFANTGSANATLTVDGTILKPGEIIDFVAPANDTLSTIEYVATGTELLIAVVE